MRARGSLTRGLGRDFLCTLIVWLGLAGAPVAFGCVQLTTPVVKSVLDLNGYPTVQGDIVRFSITFENSGSCAIEPGKLQDAVPAASTWSGAASASTRRVEAGTGRPSTTW